MSTLKYNLTPRWTGVTYEEASNRLSLCVQWKYFAPALFQANFKYCSLLWQLMHFLKSELYPGLSSGI